MLYVFQFGIKKYEVYNHKCSKIIWDILGITSSIHQCKKAVEQTKKHLCACASYDCVAIDAPSE